MDRMSDAFAFSLVSLGTVVKIIVSLIFFKSIFLQVREIGGWSYNHVLTLQGLYFLIEAVAWATYIRGFNKIYRFVENGDLDIFLTKPINLRSFFIYRYIDIFFSLPQVFIGIGLIIYGVGFNFQSLYLLPQFLILLISAFIIHYSLIVILSTINFFHIVPQTYYLFAEVSKLGQYPIDIYKGVARLVLSIIIPLAFIYSIPAQSLFSQNLLYYFVSPVIAIIFYFISKLIWQFGIKKYESARG
jgi:ABC-2 type transport system permease protein